MSQSEYGGRLAGFDEAMKRTYEDMYDWFNPPLLLLK
jgi:hypothetical protein